MTIQQTKCAQVFKLIFNHITQFVQVFLSVEVNWGGFSQFTSVWFNQKFDLVSLAWYDWIHVRFDQFGFAWKYDLVSSALRVSTISQLGFVRLDPKYDLVGSALRVSTISQFGFVRLNRKYDLVSSALCTPATFKTQFYNLFIIYNYSDARKCTSQYLCQARLFNTADEPS